MGWDSKIPETMMEVWKQAALSMFVQGSSNITDRGAGEHENPLFLHDLGFTLNGLKDDLFSLLLNLEDCSCLQTRIVSHVLGNNDSSKPV
jgi:hypothetical protein